MKESSPLKDIRSIPFLVFDQKDRGFFHAWVIIAAFLIGFLLGVTV